jgi:aryl-alcohol dehydrogenase-like predicted oxidoreductase
VKYRKLGSSDLEVPEISLGSWLTFAAIDQALGDAPVTEPTPAPFARPGVQQR